MNIDTLISMMLAPILIKFGEKIINWIAKILNIIYAQVESKFLRASITLSSQHYMGKIRVFNNFDCYENLRLIAGITEELIRRKCTVKHCLTKFISADKPDFGANGTVHYKDYTFVFSVGIINASSDVHCLEHKLVIMHRNPNKIRSFINKCVTNITRKSDKSFNQMYYGQTKNTEGDTSYNVLEFKPTVTFDDVFFPQKTCVINSIDMLLAGKLQKLSFYLHGEPGCGKSSVVKAIAAKTGYSIVEIKLSFIKNDNELRNIMFNNKLPVTVFGEEGGHQHIDVSRRIYLFEDIDAECDIVYSRQFRGVPSEHPVSPVIKKIDDKDKKIKDTKPQKLTLTGILNVLDGILAISGSIIVITTNHPEKLDSALVRYGRVTHNIQLSKLAATHATELITKFHPCWSGRVCDRHYTPAELEAICLTNDEQEVSRIMSADIVHNATTEVW